MAHINISNSVSASCILFSCCYGYYYELLVEVKKNNDCTNGTKQETFVFFPPFMFIFTKENSREKKNQ